jgi:hypothetical protein
MGFRGFAVLASLTWTNLVLAQNIAADSQSPPGRVRQAIENAKNSSLKEVTLIPTSGLPTGIKDLDGVIASHSLLVVRPITKVMTLGHPDHLMTWYKLQVIEVLWRQKTLSSDPFPEIPAQFLQIGPNELLLPTPGGIVNVDGITIHETYPINTLLMMNKKYLVCADLKRDGQVGTLVTGLDGMFSIAPDGSLKALGNADRGVALDIHQRFADDLEFVRSYVEEQAR